MLAIAGYHVVEVASARALRDAIERHRLDGELPVIVVAGALDDEPELSRILADVDALLPVVSLPRARLVARRLTADPHAILDSGTSANELVHTVDYAFASLAA